MAWRRRILIVDDDPLVTFTMKRIVEDRTSHSVLIEHDPRKAMAAALAFRPDLIILDLCMPGKDGGDVASELRRNPKLRNVPVVFLTGIASPDEAHRCSGKDDVVLSKATEIDTLLDRICGMLSPDTAAVATC